LDELNGLFSLSLLVEML